MSPDSSPGLALAWTCGEHKGRVVRLFKKTVFILFYYDMVNHTYIQAIRRKLYFENHRNIISFLFLTHSGCLFAMTVASYMKMPTE